MCVVRLSGTYSCVFPITSLRCKVPRIMKEAFYLARTGRPGPVLVDVPKDIQQQLAVPDWDAQMAITGYMNRLPAPPVRQTLAAVVDALRGAERPVAYIGGGCLDASAAITEFLDRTGIPTVQTLMGLGSYAESKETAFGMLGMHGTVAANFAVDEADLLLAIGVRFDDRVTGKLEAFAARARIVHIDIDPAEIHKNKPAHIPVCADVRTALPVLNTMLDDAPIPAEQFAPWRARMQVRSSSMRACSCFQTRSALSLPLQCRSKPRTAQPHSRTGDTDLSAKATRAAV